MTELAVIGLLLYRRVWRTFPVFLFYGFWTLLSNCLLYLIFRHSGMRSQAYAQGYFAELIVDSVIQFCVLLELGWSILRPLRPAPPRKALIPVAVLIVVLGAIIWPFASIPGEIGLSQHGAVIRHLQQTFSILRVVVLLGLAGFSQSLSLGWRDRELQIATGLGFNSLVALAVTMLHAYPAMAVQYFHLSELVVASYLCSLLYWIVSFAQKEQERHEFTPQMQSLLLAVAGAARSTRHSLEEPRSRRDSGK
ncbi:MAG: hypothetical protein ACLGSH_02950 [Acidobacteriota bacterium]